MAGKILKGARARVREYFLQNVGRVLSSNELRAASRGTSEWARRVRELRTEEGFQILTHNDRDDLKPGQYLLLDPKPIPAFGRGISTEVRAFVLDRNGFTCQMCGAVAGEPHPFDPGEERVFRSGISSTNRWAERTMPQTYAPCARSATKEPVT